MYNLFEYCYSPDGIQTYFAVTLLYLTLAAITTILFIAFLVVAIKTKKKWAIILSVLLFLISYPALTPFFEQRAIYKLVGVRMFDFKGLQAAYNTMYNDLYHNNGDSTFQRNTNEYTKNEEIAAKLSIFPAQKGFIYLQIPKQYSINDFQTAKKYYDKAHKALGSYKSKQWIMPMIEYYSNGDFDKAIEIAEDKEEFWLLADCYIMKKDYEKALEAINKSIKKSPNVYHYYALRANIHRNLGNETKALNNYNVAMKKAKTPKQKEDYTQMYNDKDYKQHQWEAAQKRREAYFNQKNS